MAVRLPALHAGRALPRNRRYVIFINITNWMNGLRANQRNGMRMRAHQQINLKVMTLKSFNVEITNINYQNPGTQTGHDSHQSNTRLIIPYIRKQRLNARNIKVICIHRLIELLSLMHLAICLVKSRVTDVTNAQTDMCPRLILQFPSILRTKGKE
jgi:hypothetical protein